MTAVAPAAAMEKDRPFIPSKCMLSKVVPSFIWFSPNSWLVMAKPRICYPRGGECLWGDSQEAGTQQPLSAGRELDSYPGRLLTASCHDVEAQESGEIARPVLL